MNSRLPSCDAAACGSSMASLAISKNPPLRPARAWALLKASSVAAAPLSEVRKARRDRPSLRASWPAHSRASWLACFSESSSGIGANSPLEVESSLMGRRWPSGSRSGVGALKLRIAYPPW
jgi:hypothetical protein